MTFRLTLLLAALALVVSGCASGTADVANSPSPSLTPSLPTSAPSTPTFEVGASFDEDCTIAWPTAPVVSAERIQLTLNCPAVPAAVYLYVVAVYDDPDLGVTPSTTDVHVSGTVTGTAATDTGFSYLLVTASDVLL